MNSHQIKLRKASYVGRAGLPILRPSSILLIGLLFALSSNFEIAQANDLRQLIEEGSKTTIVKSESTNGKQESTTGKQESTNGNLQLINGKPYLTNGKPELANFMSKPLPSNGVQQVPELNLKWQNGKLLQTKIKPKQPIIKPKIPVGEVELTLGKPHGNGDPLVGQQSASIGIPTLPHHAKSTEKPHFLFNHQSHSQQKNVSDSKKDESHEKQHQSVSEKSHEEATGHKEKEQEMKQQEKMIHEEKDGKESWNLVEKPHEEKNHEEEKHQKESSHNDEPKPEGSQHDESQNDGASAGVKGEAQPIQGKNETSPSDSKNEESNKSEQQAAPETTKHEENASSTNSSEQAQQNSQKSDRGDGGDVEPSDANYGMQAKKNVLQQVKDLNERFSTIGQHKQLAFLALYIILTLCILCFCCRKKKQTDDEEIQPLKEIQVVYQRSDPHLSNIQ